jgi:hypothetical protein
MLKDHAHFSSYLLNILDVIGQLNAVDGDTAPLMLLQAIDAADKCGFS